MELTERQFNKFRKLVYDLSEIDLHDGKLQLLKARLAGKLRRTEITSIDDYLKVLPNLSDFLDKKTHP
jgi:chemotaxis protein methyltransferase CheR